jgi:hypothetical protein
MKVEEGFRPQQTQMDVSAKRNKTFADALSVKDIELFLRALYAGFFAVDPYGLEYDRVLCVLEHAISYLKMAQECNV